MSNDPGPTHQPYGQQPNPYGQQPAWGTSQPAGDRRPGTVTAAAWITIVFSALTALLSALGALGMVVARDQVVTEMERVPEFQDANIDADAVVGVLVAIILAVVVWALIAIVLAVFVLRRSNVARILLVISSAVVVLLSLLGITSGLSVVTLVAALATIVLLFVGGAGDWFNHVQPPAGGGYGTAPYGTAPYGTAPTYPSSENPYGQQPPAPENPYGQQPPAQENPYGQQPPAQENPYGQQPPARRTRTASSAAGQQRLPAEGLPGSLTPQAPSAPVLRSPGTRGNWSLHPETSRSRLQFRYGTPASGRTTPRRGSSPASSVSGRGRRRPGVVRPRR